MAQSRLTILLVEDEPNDQLLVERAFRKAGVDITLSMVNDGEEAIAYLNGDGAFADRVNYPLPFLMLLDLKLPRVSGLDVLAWLRRQAGLRRLPVIVLTSSKEMTDINRAYDLGANSYVSKPVDSGGLIEMIKSLGAYWVPFNQRPDVESR